MVSKSSPALFQNTQIKSPQIHSPVLATQTWGFLPGWYRTGTFLHPVAICSKVDCWKGGPSCKWTRVGLRFKKQQQSMKNSGFVSSVLPGSRNNCLKYLALLYAEGLGLLSLRSDSQCLNTALEHNTHTYRSPSGKPCASSWSLTLERMPFQKGKRKLG